MDGKYIAEFYRQYVHEESEWVIVTTWGEKIVISSDENPTGIYEEMERFKKWDQ